MKKFFLMLFFIFFPLGNVFAADVVSNPFFTVASNKATLSATFSNNPVSITFENGCSYPIIANDNVSVGGIESYSLALDIMDFTSCRDVRFTVGGVDKVIPLRQIAGYDDVISFINNHSQQNSSHSGGNSSQQNNNNVTFDIGNASFARIKRGNTYWGLHIDPPQGGKIKRQKDETIYLVLTEAGGGRKQTLCKFDGGATEFAGPSFPGCFIEDSSKLFEFNGTQYGIVDIIDYGKEYGVYFSSDSQGNELISQTKALGKALPKGDTVINPNLTVEVKQNNDGEYYYHVEGDVVKARPLNLPQDAKLYLSIIDTNQNSFPLNVIPYEKGTHFSKDSQVLDSGSYALVVKSKLASNDSTNSLQTIVDLQTIPLQKQIPGGSTKTNNGNQAGTNNGNTLGDNYSDYKGVGGDEGIVPTDCGYGLGKGGRMCTLNDFIRLIRRVISYIFIIMIPIAAIVFAYAGYQLLFSGGNTQKRDAAKKAMQNLLIGIVVFLLAWTIIHIITSTLGLKSDFNIFFGS